MGEMFSEADLDTMNLVRCAFDPEVRINPGKVFPTPRLCGDRPGVYVAARHRGRRAGRARLMTRRRPRHRRDPGGSGRAPRMRRPRVDECAEVMAMAGARAAAPRLRRRRHGAGARAPRRPGSTRWCAPSGWRGSSSTRRRTRSWSSRPGCTLAALQAALARARSAAGARSAVAGASDDRRPGRDRRVRAAARALRRGPRSDHRRHAGARRRRGRARRRQGGEERRRLRSAEGRVRLARHARA